MVFWVDWHLSRSFYGSSVLEGLKGFLLKLWHLVQEVVAALEVKVVELSVELESLADHFLLLQLAQTGSLEGEGVAHFVLDLLQKLPWKEL